MPLRKETLAVCLALVALIALTGGAAAAGPGKAGSKAAPSARFNGPPVRNPAPPPKKTVASTSKPVAHAAPPKQSAGAQRPAPAAHAAAPKQATHGANIPTKGAAGPARTATKSAPPTVRTVPTSRVSKGSVASPRNASAAKSRKPAGARSAPPRSHTAASQATSTVTPVPVGQGHSQAPSPSKTHQPNTQSHQPVVVSAPAKQAAPGVSLPSPQSRPEPTVRSGPADAAGLGRSVAPSLATVPAATPQAVSDRPPAAGPLRESSSLHRQPLTVTRRAAPRLGNAAPTVSTPKTERSLTVAIEVSPDAATDRQRGDQPRGGDSPASVPPSDGGLPVTTLLTISSGGGAPVSPGALSVFATLLASGVWYAFQRQIFRAPSSIALVILIPPG